MVSRQVSSWRTLVARYALRLATGPATRRSVCTARALEDLFHAVGQRVVSEILARKQGVAAIGRHLDRVKDRAHRRLFHHRRVGVPILADDVLVTRLAADHDDLVVQLHAAVVRVDKDLAKAAGEGLVLLRVERLVAEEDHAVLIERGADLRDHGVIEIVGDVHAADLGAAPPGDRLYLDPAIAHAIPPYAKSLGGAGESVNEPGCNGILRPSRAASQPPQDEDGRWMAQSSPSS
jgi:hypothetical protein